MRGYSGIGLHNPKCHHNAGAALRACGVYDAGFMVVSGARYKKSALDTMSAYRQVPFFQVDSLRECIPYDCVPVAVDIIDGAQSLLEYEHPQRAFYIFGAEDATLGREVTDWCRDIVYVPTNGCMNLAATVNVVLYDRMLKGLK